MQATEFEFKRRLWIIASFFFVGFSLATFDHVPFIVGLRRLVAPSIARGTSEAEAFARVVIFAGALCVFLAAALRTWGAAYLRTDIVHDTAQHSHTLVADGPFRFVRNPLYFANLPMAIGIGLLASRFGFFFIVLTNTIFVYRLIFREEAAMRESQGESYLAYCRAVPRFWPALRPRLPSGGHNPAWAQAFVGESFIWIFGIAELVLAITLNTKLAIVLFAMGWGAHLVLLAALRRRSISRG